MAEVIATDLSPIQETFVPPNLSFLIDDCEEEWTFSNGFDFIHIGHMVYILLHPCVGEILINT
jgi:hypothetical protein